MGIFHQSSVSDSGLVVFSTVRGIVPGCAWSSRAVGSATSKVPYLLAPTHCKISNMDDSAKPLDADKIARAYLKHVRQYGPEIGGKTRTPGVQAWLDLEKRLMLGPVPNEPNEVKHPKPQQTSPGRETKKAQSIWKRSISELWRSR